jgi:hypothetical protein
MNSEIRITSGGTMYSGPDAVAMYRAVTVKVAIETYARTKMRMTRNATPTVLLGIAGEYTGKKYKRGQYDQAAKDLAVWIETMRAALPVTVEGEEE